MRSLVSTGLAVIAATLMVLAQGSGALHAQGAKKNSCPGGFSACVQRCQKAGGQPRLCPSYCQKEKGC